MQVRGLYLETREEDHLDYKEELLRVDIPVNDQEEVEVVELPLVTFIQTIVSAPV